MKVTRTETSIVDLYPSGLLFSILNLHIGPPSIS